MVDDDAAEEAANRILDAFGIDVRNEDEFDALCDIIDHARGETPRVVCRHIGNADLSEEVATALLMTLLKDQMRKMRAKLVSTSAAQQMADMVLGPLREG